MKTLRLGTRKSPLARTQSQMVADQVMKSNPGLKVELVGIETQGDRILDVALSQIDGKEFFVKELDTALLNKEVDFTVHSLKDLSLERPSGVKLAAIPAREDIRDVLLFNRHALDRMVANKPLRIGTSSPRRLHNLSEFLKVGLPKVSDHASPKFEFVEIRGNVHTRLSRIHEKVSHAKYLDGVVLALAGLSRLAEASESRDSIVELLCDVRWMIPPLSQNPTSPGQGALAVECREDDEATYSAIRPIHDADSFQQISRERELMAEWGGGCHQRFGISVVDAGRVGSVMFQKGLKANNESVDDLIWDEPEHRVFSNCKIWDGMKCRPRRDALEVSVPKKPVYFVANARSVLGINTTQLNNARVWCSGFRSWRKLAEMGVWVEGCADSLGFEFIRPLIGKRILSLPKLEEWCVLTHSKAVSGWQECEAIAPYDVVFEDDSFYAEGLGTADVVFWASGYQFDCYSKFVSENVVHCCGAGKTADHLTTHLKQDFFPFPSYKSWLKFINKRNRV